MLDSAKVDVVFVTTWVKEKKKALSFSTQKVYLKWVVNCVFGVHIYSLFFCEEIYFIIQTYSVKLPSVIKFTLSIEFYQKKIRKK